ncbi:hypothetical protein ColTof3_06268 [Colletotrichum tofieldiae]|nr:hypothetical protein ColTof3_06268 [Colletotrichum tofieldiae]
MRGNTTKLYPTESWGISEAVKQQPSPKVPQLRGGGAHSTILHAGQFPAVAESKGLHGDVDSFIRQPSAKLGFDCTTLPN